MPTPEPLKEQLLPLEEKNAHPRDKRVVFDAVAHTYSVDGKIYPTSISGFLHDFFPEFDAAKTVEQYYDKWASDKSSRYYQLIAYLKNVVGFSDERLIKAEIAGSWAASGRSASGAGTKTHRDVELRLNGVEHDAESTEVKQFEEWYSRHPTWKPFRCEWSLFDEKLLLAGQLDALFLDEETGDYIMADW
jgi:hypothetical protein